MMRNIDKTRVNLALAGILFCLTTVSRPRWHSQAAKPTTVVQHEVAHLSLGAWLRALPTDFKTWFHAGG